MRTKHTAEIFDLLRRGQFICSNSPNNHIQMLYRVLDDPDVFNDLSDYFSKINYKLEQGNEFFYFSKPESNVSLERKLHKAFEWIDILDFFKTYHSAFDVGFRFTPAEVTGQLKNNADLKSKLKSLKNTHLQKRNYSENIKKLIERLEKENFVALEDELSETYKVLTAFHYLKDLVNSINIAEDVDYETPE